MAADFDLLLCDLGGVIHEFDDQAMTEVWLEAGVDIAPAVTFFGAASGIDDGEEHILHRAERGELSLAELLALAEPEAPGITHMLDASQPTSLQRFIRPSESWADLVREIGGHGIATGALTNTFDGFGMEMLRTHNPPVHDHIVELFGDDDVLESHVIGQRKPRPNTR